MEQAYILKCKVDGMYAEAWGAWYGKGWPFFSCSSKGLYFINVIALCHCMHNIMCIMYYAIFRL